jgi:hypothetical protein
MGLDFFAAHSPEISLTEADLRTFEEAGIDLCGGIFSGGAGSFRGEAYDTLLINVTSANLYKGWIPPEEVYKMWLAFENCDPEKLLEWDKQNYESLDQEYRGDSLEKLTADILELRKFFRVCAERGLGLIGTS